MQTASCSSRVHKGELNILVFIMKIDSRMNS